VIALSDRRLHYRFRRGPDPGEPDAGNEFSIRYPSLAGLSFSVGDSRIRVRRARPGAGYWWPVESASAAELSAAVQLLNRMALAVRSVPAVELDEPFTPQPGRSRRSGCRAGAGQPAEPAMT
jgi:hypothetical protein